jgi:hypothetical protein
MGNIKRGALVAAAGLGVVAGVPAVASAADVNAGVACVRSDFVNRNLEAFPLAGTGFTPGSAVTFRMDSTVVGSGVADAAGNVTVNGTGPVISDSDRNLQTFGLTATDSAGITTVAKPLPVVRTGVSIPKTSKPRRTSRFRLFGFVPNQVLYLHIRRGGKTLGTYRMGTTDAACGNVTRKLRYMPLKRYRTGTYDYYFDHSKKYTAATRLYRVKISITRTFR